AIPGPTSGGSKAAVGPGAAPGSPDGPASAWAARSRATRSASAASPPQAAATYAARAAGSAWPRAWWKTDSTSLGSGGMGPSGVLSAPSMRQTPAARLTRGGKKSGPAGRVAEAVVQPGPGVGPPAVGGGAGQVQAGGGLLDRQPAEEAEPDQL